MSGCLSELTTSFCRLLTTVSVQIKGIKERGEGHDDDIAFLERYPIRHNIINCNFIDKNGLGMWTCRHGKGGQDTDDWICIEISYLYILLWAILCRLSFLPLSDGVGAELAQGAVVVFCNVANGKWSLLSGGNSIKHSPESQSGIVIN